MSTTGSSPEDTTADPGAVQAPPIDVRLLALAVEEARAAVEVAHDSLVAALSALAQGIVASTGGCLHLHRKEVTQYGQPVRTFLCHDCTEFVEEAWPGDEDDG